MGSHICDVWCLLLFYFDVLYIVHDRGMIRCASKLAIFNFKISSLYTWVLGYHTNVYEIPSECIPSLKVIIKNVLITFSKWIEVLFCIGIAFVVAKWAGYSWQIRFLVQLVLLCSLLNTSPQHKFNLRVEKPKTTVKRI